MLRPSRKNICRTRLESNIIRIDANENTNLVVLANEGAVACRLLLALVLWGMQWNSVARDAEIALVSRVANEIKSVEKQGLAYVTPAQSAPIDEGSATLADPAYLIGIDVSHYQRNVNWNQVAEAGVVFAFAKATGGNDFVDPHFAQNWYGMREVKLYRGAYHFFLADDDPIEQAKSFTNTLGELRSNDRPPMLDAEQSDNTYAKTLQAGALVWL
ncbi:hypothetical protein G3495_21710 [Shewanella baltica]|nr:hypothetical protein [Shewanella baltica]MCS6258942.1 hypothetical protein [Shewanella baltica]MCS6272274.1 hypothetical protein [Shewanella baltica]